MYKTVGINGFSEKVGRSNIRFERWYVWSCSEDRSSKEKKKDKRGIKGKIMGGITAIQN